MYQLNLDQLHSSQMMLMVHKNLSSYSKNITKKLLLKIIYYINIYSYNILSFKSNDVNGAQKSEFLLKKHYKEIIIKKLSSH